MLKEYLNLILQRLNQKFDSGLVHLFLVVTLAVNLADFIINKGIMNYAVFSDIYLSLILLIVYFSYLKMHNKNQVLGIISLTYVCIVIFLNRRLQIPDVVNILLAVPFLISVLYFFIIAVKKAPKNKFPM